MYWHDLTAWLNDYIRDDNKKQKIFVSFVIQRPMKWPVKNYIWVYAPGNWYLGWVIAFDKVMLKQI